MMKFVCRLDQELYQCAADHITSDKVILTNERIEHIKKHHPGDLERFYGYIPEIIRDPDYIMEDTRPDTAVVLKDVTEAGEHFRLALRLVTPKDEPGYQNSILTFMKVRKKEWDRLLRNKKILYKSE